MFVEQALQGVRSLQRFHNEKLTFEFAAVHLWEQYGITIHLLEVLRKERSAPRADQEARIVRMMIKIFEHALEGQNPEETRSLYEELQTIERQASQLLHISSNLNLTRAAPRHYVAWGEDNGHHIEVDCSCWDSSRTEGQLSLFNPGSVGTDTTHASNEPVLSVSQQAAVKRLNRYWDLLVEQTVIAGIKPRTSGLIIGPSGVGKTHVVREFAGRKGVPMIDINIGSWIVTGAKAEPAFIETLGKFVDENESGVVFIDEVDKLHGTSDWNKSIQQEAYALLDRRMETFSGWHDDRLTRFKQSYLIVGAGTWQHLQPARTKCIGFGGENKGTPTMKVDLDTQTSIPDELLFRFNADLIFIDPLSVAELREKIQQIYAELALDEPAARILDSLAQRAFASGKQHRWLEALVSRLAIRCR